MRRLISFGIAAFAAVSLSPSLASSEILAFVNYQSKPGQEIKREGIAVLDVDPQSQAFGDIVMDLPLPPDTKAHHISYNKAGSKVYVTAGGETALRVIDMERFPYRVEEVQISGCEGGETLALSEDDSTWYLTCIGSDNVIVGVIEASTGKVLSTQRLSDKAAPSGEAPVEIAFRPGAEPPQAYITTMFGGTLWAATWNPSRKAFDFGQAFDFTKAGSRVPLEMYFNSERDRLYVTTAKPGSLNIFDIGENPLAPTLLQTIPAAPGAHHVAFSPDKRYAFVQNNLMNMMGMDDGSITVIDLEKGAAVKEIDTLKTKGLSPNGILLITPWRKAPPA